MANRGRPHAPKMNPITAIRIKEARDKKQWSKYRLAKEIHCDDKCITNWEEQKTGISDENLKMISAVLEVPLDWLKGESISDIIQNSISILQGFNPETASDYSSQLSEQAESESLAIIYALKMCGKDISDVKDKSQFSDYMRESIQSLIENYFNTLN